ncbi:MAG TPA: glycerophosphodiester phosphodiesterase family protein [Terriglobia bacterium]|nr:glycerophosphodiester phosphodiesterase family protein [Terriglobia bacterium]
MPLKTAPLAARPLILAHRGASAEAPENTLAAFELAMRQGADGIECDVRLSADGAPVVIHDARLDRTTSGRGRVDRHTTQELRRLDAGSRFCRRHPALAKDRYRGAKIPLLAEAMDWVGQHGCLAYVEIKRERADLPRLEEQVLQAVNAAGARTRVTLISFHLPTLRRLRVLDGGIALGLDCTRPLLAIRRAQSVRAAVVLPHGTFVSRRFIERAHRAGLRVVPWGAHSPRAWQRLLALGADGIIGNRPALMRRTAALAGEWRTAEDAL